MMLPSLRPQRQAARRCKGLRTFPLQAAQGTSPEAAARAAAALNNPTEPPDDRNLFSQDVFKPLQTKGTRQVT